MTPAVVDVVNLIGLEPGTGEPGVLAADTSAHFAVVNEVATPAVGDPTLVSWFSSS